MRFQRYDSLRIFTVVARHGSLASAADELALTKGAVSHQIRQLEQALGFPVFDRQPRGMTPTAKGQELLSAARTAFQTLDGAIDSLRLSPDRVLTIGVTTYFASRWLSPRLMDFMRHHPEIRLRIQPMIDLMNFYGEGVDLAIRWGDGAWQDARIERLFQCSAWPSGNAEMAARVDQDGLASAFAAIPLLHDREDSDAWARWHKAADLPFRTRSGGLIVPDPNVRVQAVIDGQGIALNDTLIEAEIAEGKLFRLGQAELSDYGYFLAYAPGMEADSATTLFADWIKSEAVKR